jgi:hypothetical protein
VGLGWHQAEVAAGWRLLEEEGRVGPCGKDPRETVAGRCGSSVADRTRVQSWRASAVTHLPPSS